MPPADLWLGYGPRSTTVRPFTCGGRNAWCSNCAASIPAGSFIATRQRAPPWRLFETSSGSRATNAQRASSSTSTTRKATRARSPRAAISSGALCRTGQTERFTADPHPGAQIARTAQGCRRKIHFWPGERRVRSRPGSPTAELLWLARSLVVCSQQFLSPDLCFRATKAAPALTCSVSLPRASLSTCVGEGSAGSGSAAETQPETLVGARHTMRMCRTIWLPKAEALTGIPRTRVGRSTALSSTRRLWTRW
jgi:hypothetical protein